MYQKLTFFCITRLYFVLYAFGALHLSRELYKSTLILTNKPNFQNAKMMISLYFTRGYERIQPMDNCQNKPNSNPIKANSNPIKANFPNRRSEFANRKSLGPIQTQFPRSKSKIGIRKSKIHWPNFRSSAQTGNTTIIVAAGGVIELTFFHIPALMRCRNQKITNICIWKEFYVQKCFSDRRWGDGDRSFRAALRKGYTCSDVGI